MDSSIPPAGRNWIFDTHTVDAGDNDQDTYPGTALPYQEKIVTRLTEQEILDLDPETARTLACLRETRYYWKDLNYHSFPTIYREESESSLIAEPSSP